MELPDPVIKSANAPPFILINDEDVSRRTAYYAWTASDFQLSVVSCEPDLIASLIERRPEVILVATVDSGMNAVRCLNIVRKMQKAAKEKASSFYVISPSDLWVRLALLGLDFDGHLLTDDLKSEFVSLLEELKNRDLGAAGRPWIEKAIADQFPDYVQSRLRLLEEINVAILNRRRDIAAKLAHQLRGSPGLHDFEEAIAACRIIEDFDGHPDLQEVQMQAYAAKIERLIRAIVPA